MASQHLSVVLPFPIRGVVDTLARTKQQPRTTVDMLNMLPFDRSLRLRGATRPGTLALWVPPITGSSVSGPGSSSSSSSSASSSASSSSSSPLTCSTCPGGGPTIATVTLAGMSGFSTGLGGDVSALNGIAYTCTPSGMSGDQCIFTSAAMPSPYGGGSNFHVSAGSPSIATPTLSVAGLIIDSTGQIIFQCLGSGYTIADFCNKVTIAKSNTRTFAGTASVVWT